MRDGRMEVETRACELDNSDPEERKLFDEGMEDLFFEFQMK